MSKEIKCEICSTVVIIAETGSKIKPEVVCYCQSCNTTVVSIMRMKRAEKKKPFDFNDRDFGNIFGDIFSGK